MTWSDFVAMFLNVITFVNILQGIHNSFKGVLSIKRRNKSKRKTKEKDELLTEEKGLKQIKTTWMKLRNLDGNWKNLVCFNACAQREDRSKLKSSKTGADPSASLNIYTEAKPISSETRFAKCWEKESTYMVLKLRTSQVDGKISHQQQYLKDSHINFS